MLKDADGAPVANQNFHDVEATGGRAASLPQPAIGGAADRLFLAIIDGEVAGPTLFGPAGLHLDEDQHLSLPYHEVEFIQPMPPIAGQDGRALGTVMADGLRLSPLAEGFVGGR